MAAPEKQQGGVPSPHQRLLQRTHRGLLHCPALLVTHLGDVFYQGGSGFCAKPAAKEHTTHTQASGEKLCCPSLYATLTLSGCIELFQCICFPQGSCLRDDWTCHINRLIITEYVLLMRLAATT